MNVLFENAFANGIIYQPFCFCKFDAMKIFTAAQISEWDKYTIKEEPVAAVDLMERAATACFNWIKENIPVTKNFAIFCGSAYAKLRF